MNDRAAEMSEPAENVTETRLQNAFKPGFLGDGFVPVDTTAPRHAWLLVRRQSLADLLWVWIEDDASSLLRLCLTVKWSSMLRPPEHGWQVVPPQWWRIPYTAVSWAYQDAAVAHKVAPSTASLFHIRSDDLHDEDISTELNPHLVGCQSALDAVESYEANVGFDWPPPPEMDVQAHPDLTVVRKEEHVAVAKEQWDGLVRVLTGGLSIADCHHDSDDDDSLSDVQRSTSSIDLTDSERSVLSLPMPATPTARRSFANILVKRPSASRSSSHSSERSPHRLNAAASAFVPSPSKPRLQQSPVHSRTPSPPSPTFNTTFVFPSLNTPAVKIAKDEQGFYYEVPAPAPVHSHSRSSSSSNSLLPGFLHPRRRTPTSKTRAIVDRLKSGTPAESAAREPVKSPPPLELSTLAKRKPRLSLSEDGDAEDDGGWICMDEGVAAAAAATAATPDNAKTRRTRDLFLALTRRRANSSPTRSSAVEAIKVELPSPLPTSASDDGDGWIEGNALLLPPEPVKIKAPSPSPVRKVVPLPKPTTAPPRPRRTKRAPPPVPVPVPVPVFGHPPPPPLPGMWYYAPHPQQYAATAQAQAYMHMQHCTAGTSPDAHAARATRVGSHAHAPRECEQYW
ncbi:hypothetical protein FB45DRAFT_860893 [Roridomyces roridus]|uniref:Uncharacterized protein n=1 Tax=Roridomyces roridus TaxID=1738132 RepID=A0AAD7FZN2_9AGAR|nr:hypothetical protein FB45DRAFT_860893 [Roridomyces roridus]